MTLSFEVVSIPPPVHVRVMKNSVHGRGLSQWRIKIAPDDQCYSCFKSLTPFYDGTIAISSKYQHHAGGAWPRASSHDESVFLLVAATQNWNLTFSRKKTSYPSWGYHLVIRQSQNKSTRRQFKQSICMPSTSSAAVSVPMILAALMPFTFCQIPSRMFEVPRLALGSEEFVNLKGFLVQSSGLFGISSVQFSSLGTSLSVKFVQFSSGHRGQVPHSVRSVQFTNSSGSDWHLVPRSR